MNIAVNPHKILRELLRTEFLAFAERCFQHLEPGKRFEISNHMVAIAYALRRVLEGKTKRLIISMPPRMLKSHLVSIAFPAFAMARNPGIRIVTASHTADLAQTFNMRSRAIVQSDWYKEMAPKVRLSRSTQTEIETTSGGSRLSIGVDGALLGRGGDIIIIDDAMASDGGVSEADRKKVWDWFTGVVGSRLDHPKEGAIIVVAQRLHVDDLTGKLLAAGGWEHLCLPAIAWEDQAIPLSETKTWKRRSGEFLMPTRLGKTELDGLRKMQEHRFEAQYQQRPAPPAGFLFKLQKFRRYSRELLPRGQLEGVFLSVDSALSSKAGSDFTAITVWGIREHNVYLRHVERGRWTFREQMLRITTLSKHFEADMTIVENHASGPMLHDELKLTGFPVIGYSQRHDKSARAELADDKIHRGIVHIDETMKDYAAFTGELAAFPHGKNDDWVDSMTMFLMALDSAWPTLPHLSYYRHHQSRRSALTIDRTSPWLV